MISFTSFPCFSSLAHSPDSFISSPHLSHNSIFRFTNKRGFRGLVLYLFSAEKIRLFPLRMTISYKSSSPRAGFNLVTYFSQNLVITCLKCALRYNNTSWDLGSFNVQVIETGGVWCKFGWMRELKHGIVPLDFSSEMELLFCMLFERPLPGLLVSPFDSIPNSSISGEKSCLTSRYITALTDATLLVWMCDVSEFGTQRVCAVFMKRNIIILPFPFHLILPSSLRHLQTHTRVWYTIYRYVKKVKG